MDHFASKRFPSFLFVRTDFVRRGTPVFACAAMESRRRIRLNWEQRGLPIESQIALAQILAREHYRQASGRIEFWGNICGYLFQYAKDITPVTIDIDGQITQEKGTMSPAEIRVCGKPLLQRAPT